MHEWLFTLGVVLAAGLCGAGFLRPFADRNKLALLASPLAGILVVVLGANACYAVICIPYKTAATISALACLAVSGIGWRNLFLWRQISLLVVLAAGISALAVSTVDRATILCGGPAILYFNGTDQGGYSQMADWLNNHLVNDPPIATPQRPYESFPELLFRIDPRFGSHGLVAIVSRLHGTSGLFSYDVTCAVMMSAACLSVAAVFAPNVLWLAPLMLGLFISDIFDYTRTGFFAKSIAFPSALMLAGLALNSLRSATVEQIFCLMILACGTGIMLAGITTAVLIAPILVMALVAMLLWTTDRTMLRRAALLCGLLVVIPVMASGVAAKPLTIDVPRWDVPWSFILPRLLDLENPVVYVSRCGPGTLDILMILVMVGWIAAIIAAVVWRNPRAFGLLTGPLVLVATMALCHSRAAVFELPGYVYPAMLCGTVALFEQLPPRHPRGILVIALTAMAIGLHVQRFTGEIAQYVTRPPREWVFSEYEIQQLAQAIGSQSVEVDIDNPQDAIVVLDELCRRKLDIRWSQRGWTNVLDYRHWPWTPPGKTDFLLIRDLHGQPQHHFDLIRTDAK